MKQYLFGSDDLKHTPVGPFLGFLYASLKPKDSRPYVANAYLRGGKIWATNGYTLRTVDTYELPELPEGWVIIEKAGAKFQAFTDPGIDATYPDLSAITAGFPEKPTFTGRVDNSLNLSELYTQIIRRLDDACTIDFTYLDALKSKDWSVAEVFLKDGTGPVKIRLPETVYKATVFIMPITLETEGAK